MKRYSAADILSHVFIPLIAYLLTGLIVIRLSGASINSTYYIVWGIMAGVIMAIKEYFDNKTVTVGIGIYAFIIVTWFGMSAGDNNKIHMAMAVLGLCSMFLLKKIFKYKIIRLLSGYVVLITLICFEFADISFSKGIIALSIVLLLNSVSETICIHNNCNVNSLIIIYAVIAMLTVVMPAPKEPYDWGFVIKAVNTVNKMVEKIVFEMQCQWGNESDGIFHYGYTGYSDAPISLSSSLNNKDIIQLMIQGKRTRRNLYLKGNVCDSYIGNTWETNVREETIDYLTDTMTTLYAIFNYTQDKYELRKFMEVHEQEITMQNIKTQSLFYPLKLLEIMETNVQYDGDNLRSDKINTRGYDYFYRFVDIDYSNSDLIKIIVNSKDIKYDEETYNMIFDKMKEYYDVELEKIPFNIFLQRVTKGQTAVEEQYTFPGDSVSEKVVMLADDITEGCSNDYEKCKALERYLYQYNYNKKINVPDDIDVLDWFLFDGKEGYCAHYATALAVMLRCEGIPSRLAEGFLVDYKDYIDIYNFSVSSNTAHVWVEAYIEGFGWIRLEPTVINAGNANAVWYADSADEEETQSEEETEVEDVELYNVKESEDIWLIMLMIIIGMAVIIITILLILLMYRRIHVRKSIDPDVVLLHLLSVLGKKYSPKGNGETVREYIERLLENKQIPDEKKDSLLIILGLMEKYWYGAGNLSEGDVKLMKEVRNGFL